MVTDQLSSQFFISVKSRESHLGWLCNIIGLSIKRSTFTTGENMKPRFLRQYIVFFNNFFKKLKNTLLQIFWSKNPDLKKIIDLKFYCNLNGGGVHQTHTTAFSRSRPMSPPWTAFRLSKCGRQAQKRQRNRINVGVLLSVFAKQFAHVRIRQSNRFLLVD